MHYPRALNSRKKGETAGRKKPRVPNLSRARRTEKKGLRRGESSLLPLLPPFRNSKTRCSRNKCSIRPDGVRSRLRKKKGQRRGKQAILITPSLQNPSNRGKKSGEDTPARRVFSLSFSHPFSVQRRGEKRRNWEGEERGEKNAQHRCRCFLFGVLRQHDGGGGEKEGKKRKKE